MQFSCFSAITPRVRAGRSGLTCGYCTVTAGRSIVFIVTVSPLSRPWPTPDSGWSSCCVVSMATVSVVLVRQNATLKTAAPRIHTSEIGISVSHANRCS